MNPQLHPWPMFNRPSRPVSLTIAQLLLWLWVINLGIALGAGLYEAAIVFPQWLVAVPEGGYQWQAEAARAADTGLSFWVYVTTVPLTLLTLANAIAAWPQRGKLRRWWLGAVGLALAERLFTFGYFVPTMLHLMGDDLSAIDAVDTALQWGHLNHLRHLLVVVAWLAALRTFSLLHQRALPKNSDDSPKTVL